MSEDNNRASGANANMEQNIRDESPLPENGFKAQDTRVNIRIRNYRRLDTDPDGVSIKAALDGLVERGILANDSSKQIKSITIEVIKSKEEKTIIEIEDAAQGASNAVLNA